MNKVGFGLAAAAVVVVGCRTIPVPEEPLAESSARRVMMPERLAMGNVNVKPVQPIDSAAWIWSDGDAMVRLFRREFTSGGGMARVHVSADNRYVLKLDGRRIGRGPDRGTLERWTYQTYELELKPGRHVIEAVVQRLGESTFVAKPDGGHVSVSTSPLAQLYWWKTGGFILKAEGALDAELTTGKAPWKVASFDNLSFTGDTAGTFGVGGANEIVGSSPWFADPDDAAFVDAKIVRESVHEAPYGLVMPGWRLYPSVLPQQLEAQVRPGRFRACAANAADDYVYAEADARAKYVGLFDALVAGDQPVTIPAHTEINLLWDLENYYCAYPELETEGGAGAMVKWGWAETLFDAKGAKGNRSEFVGKRFLAFADTFRPDGGSDVFTTTWWRPGRWCRLLVKTDREPLVIKRASLFEVHYPTPYEESFACDDESIEGVLAICRRGLQMCSHEMGFDCPYYEQQMYPGDSRIQYLIHDVACRDDRLVRSNIALYDYSRREDGRVGFNFPTTGVQEGGSYSLIWPMMLGDYAMWRDNAEWLKYRLPGLLHSLEGFKNWVNADGLIEGMPGWNFQDWTDWPGGHHGQDRNADGVNAFNSLFYIYALKSGATVCRALGEDGFASVYEKRAADCAKAVVDKFWSSERGLLADDPEKRQFSEHVASLALLLDILPKGRAESVAKHLVEDADLIRATVYFSHYLFDAYAKIGRNDLFLKRLDLWRGYVKAGLKTPQESPGNARSDCHAWGSHPIYHLHANVLGIKPGNVFFQTVRIAPQPGGLKWIKARTPHPKGIIESDLRFADGKVSGTIRLPEGLGGMFEWNGQTRVLKPGEQTIEL